MSYPYSTLINLFEGILALFYFFHQNFNLVWGGVDICVSVKHNLWFDLFSFNIPKEITLVVNYIILLGYAFILLPLLFVRQKRMVSRLYMHLFYIWSHHSFVYAVEDSYLVGPKLYNKFYISHLINYTLNNIRAVKGFWGLGDSMVILKISPALKWLYLCYL